MQLKAGKAGDVFVDHNLWNRDEPVLRGLFLTVWGKNVLDSFLEEGATLVERDQVLTEEEVAEFICSGKNISYIEL